MDQKKLETGASIFGHLVYDKDTLEGPCRKNDLFKNHAFNLASSWKKNDTRLSGMNCTIHN